MKTFVQNRLYSLILSAALAIAGTACGLVPFLCVYWIADAVVADRFDESVLTTYALAAVAAIVAKVSLNMLSSAISHRAAYAILYDIRRALISKIDCVPLGFFADNSVASLKKVISEDVEQIEEALAHAVPDLASAIAVPIAVGLFLAFIDWRLALAALALYPLLVLIYPISLKIASAEMGGYFSALLGLRAAALEFLQGMKVIRAFLAVDSAFSKLDDAISAMSQATWKMSTAAAVPSALMMVGLRANVLALLPVGGLLVVNGQVTPNQFVLFLLMGMGVNASVYKLLYTAGNFAMRMGQAGKNIENILGTASLPTSDSPQTNTSYGIEFEDVSFSYENGRGVQNVSFSAPQDSYTAIVGPSGGGKTTLARLIGRFWEIDEGTIRIGGVDIRDMSPDALISQISYVMQEPWLLNTTIRENIRSARPEASDEEVNRAASRARVLDFSNEMEGGLDSPVGEGGKLLSGGQRQRVAIARAILRASPIIIMDEGTSALDPDNEAQVLDALSELAVGRTVIAIAHRLDTIRRADNILYFEEGELLDQAPHEELVKRCPAYAQLCSKYAAAGGWTLQKGEASKDFLADNDAEENVKSADAAAEPEAAPLQTNKSAIKLALELAGPMRKLLLSRAVPLLFLEALLMGAPVVATILVLLDLYNGTLTTGGVLTYVGWVTGLFCAQVVFHVIASRSIWKVQTGAVAALQRRIADHLRRVPLGVLQQRDTGALETLLTQNTTQLNYVTPSSQLIRAVVAPMISLAFMLYFDWRLALCVVATIPVFLLVIMFCDRISDKVWHEMFESREGMNARIIDYLRGVPTLRSLGLRGSESDALTGALAKHRDVSLATVMRVSPAVSIGLSALDLGFCAVLFAGGLLMISGSITFQLYLVFMVIGLVFYGPIGDAFELVFYRRQQERSMGRIADVLNLPALPSTKDYKKLYSFDIRFDDVGFAYETQARNVTALSGASFDIQAGDITAFVGPSGSGKSTALNLLARFWDVDKGAIKIGGVDLKVLPDGQRAKLFAIVFQDTFLLDDTIANNLKLARPGITDDEMVEAAKAARCHEFIMELDQGYNSPVGEGGQALSGGQRQRIAIARALLKDAPIVLLDEATAAIDPENEFEIRAALASLCRGRTVIVVAHRLSSIIGVDQIVVFDKGQIAARGAHASLYETCATYRRLWDAQHKLALAEDAPDAVGA